MVAGTRDLSAACFIRALVLFLRHHPHGSDTIIYGGLGFQHINFGGTQFIGVAFHGMTLEFAVLVNQ